jgi:uncharacterized protein
VSEKKPSNGAQQLKALYGAVIKGDLEAVVKLLHPEFVVVEPESLPYGGTYRGRDAFLGELLPKMTKDFQLVLEDVRVLDGGDVVAGQLTAVFTSRKSGRALRVPYVEICSFKDGLISLLEVYPQDTHRIVDFMRDETA